jgi:hypothetical protein
VGGNGNLVREAQFHQGLPLEVGMGLDLVRGGGDARVAQDVADQEHVIVAARTTKADEGQWGEFDGKGHWKSVGSIETPNKESYPHVDSY